LSVSTQPSESDTVKPSLKTSIAIITITAYDLDLSAKNNPRYRTPGFDQTLHTLERLGGLGLRIVQQVGGVLLNPGHF
jgi:hypothetical protein